MPLSLSIPINIDAKLYSLLQEILRRAMDGTAAIILLDNANQRVLIGSSVVSSGTAGKLEVTGDIKIVGTSVGLVLEDTNGSARTYRLQVEEVPSEDGSLQPVIKLTRAD